MKRFLIGFGFPESKGIVDYVAAFGKDMQEAKNSFIRNIKTLSFAVDVYGCYEIPDFIKGCVFDNRKIAEILRRNGAEYEFFAFINR